MKIKAICETITSARDVNGNSYHAFRFISTETGNRVWGLLASDSELKHCACEVGLDYSEIYDIQRVIPKRQFRRMVKSWTYYGSNDLIAAIKKCNF